MDERLAQIKELVGQINSIIAEIEGEIELPPEEKKIKEREEYLKKPPEEKEKIDKNSVLGKKPAREEGEE